MATVSILKHRAPLEPCANVKDLAMLKTEEPWENIAIAA